MRGDFTPPTEVLWCPRCSTTFRVLADLQDPCPHCGGSLVTPPGRDRGRDDDE